jgi:hypothetical protein
MRRASTWAAAQPMSDADAPPVAGIFAGNILRLSLRGQRWAIHWNDQAARSAPGDVQKREAPAVAGPGLSCRDVTTILADRDVAP